MNHWMIVASRDHLMRGVEGGFCQANHGKRAPLARMSAGDGVVFYSPKERYGFAEPLQQFTAIGQVKDDDIYRVEVSPDFQPYRRNVTFFPCKPVAIRPLLDRLAFIADKSAWGFVFRQGFFGIPEADFTLLSKLMLNDEK
jgi:hypothetical protein